MTRRLVVIGDCLLDRDVVGEAERFTPDGPAPVLEEHEVHARPGGAGLAALLAARDGGEVTFVTALADDRGGAELAELLEAAGVDVIDLGSRAATSEKIRLRADGHSLARWDRGGRTTAEDIGPWSDAAQRAVDGSDAVLVSCYGRGVTGRVDVRDAVARAAANRSVVWDPHPRGARPVPGVSVATPNRDEVELFTSGDHAGDHLEGVTRRAEELTHRWSLGGCAVTLGSDGALYTSGHGLPLVAPAPHVAGGDPCGAGDRFSSSMAVQLADGRVVSEAVTGAVHAAARFVAAGGAGAVRVGESPGLPETPPPGADDAFALAERIRARGGTLVATGGCFDIVHTGHVQLLEAARALGDALIVCLNSDDSVRRLKGEGRPIVPQEDRAALVGALSCVDGVVVFDDDTPVPVLRRLRPDVFAKGGDYGGTTIPESEALAGWNGQAVTLPYLEGRSTTRLLEEVRQREHS